MTNILTIELVPSTCFFSNVRSMVSVKNWNILRTQCYQLANHRCEICDQSNKWQTTVECHEVWEYDDINKIQRLDKLITLCPSCHRVKHWGLAIINGKEKENYKHFMSINNIDLDQAIELVKEAFKKHKERSNYKWKVDLSYLDNKNIKYKLDRK